VSPKKVLRDGLLAAETPLGTVLVSCKREAKAENNQTSGDALQTSSGTYAATAFFRVLLFTQDGDQKVSMPAVSIDTAGGRDPIEKLLNTVNPLLFSAGIVKVRTSRRSHRPSRSCCTD
jgi:hypothetical protein